MLLDNLTSKLASLETKLVDLEIQLDSKNAELLDLARVGALITAFLEIDKILSAMMEISLRLLHAEVGCILVWEDGIEPVTKISWGIDYELVRLIKLEGQMDIAQWTKSTGETVIINEFPPETQIPAKVSSVMSAPLNCRNETLGVLIVVNKTNEDGFNSEDSTILETLVNFATVAIENAKLLEERLIKQKLEQELDLAKEVQKALLPSDDFAFQGARVSHIYYPAGQVGGDYYDIIPISSKSFVVIVGDVSNKGVPAALMMTAVRSVVRNEVRSNRDVAQLMNNINLTLCQDVMRRQGMFITLFLALIDVDKMEMVFSNAGHLPPLFYHVERKEIVHLNKGGMILGLFEECKYEAVTIRLRPGDRMLCFTDGITESEDKNGNMYGTERLVEFTSKHKELLDNQFLSELKADVDKFAKGFGESQFDDLTSVLISID